MIETKIPVLPPGLEGETQFILTLTIDEILWELESQPVQVRVEWWGQSPEESQIFTPVDVENFTKSKIGDVLFARYEIKTSAHKLTEYLRDASPLKVDVIDVNDQVVGTTLVHNLQQITDSSCGFEGYYPVAYSETKEIIANLRIHLILETIDEFNQKSKAKVQKRVLRSRKTVQKSDEKGKEDNRVQFSCGKPRKERSTSGSSDRARPNKGSPKKTPLADSIVSELLNQSQELRKSMQEKLESNFGGPVNPDSENDRRPVPSEPRSCAPRESVPSWNLPVERMRVLACVSRLEVSVASVQVSPVILDKIYTKETSKSSSGGKPTRRDTGSVSFFVKYRLPSDNEETSLCTRKLKGNYAEFNEKRSVPIIFTSDTLEDWWNFKTEFKVYSRHLGQRVPLLIGEATLGMKYLLLHDRYTGGAPLSLPIYVANALFRELKLPQNTSEIVGNIHLSIQLAYRSTVKSRPGSSTACTSDKIPREVEQIEKQECLRIDKDKPQADRAPSSDQPQFDKEEYESQRKPRSAPCDDQELPVSSKGRVTINSRPRNKQSATFREPLYLEMRVSVVDSYDVFHVKHRNLDFCEGQVSHGQDLVVTSLLFLGGEDGAIHNRLMLSRLTQNYLILQVWRKEQLVGIAKVETDPIHEAYQYGETDQNQCLTFCDEDIDVLDIFDSKKVAELHVRVRVGGKKFINPPDSVNTSFCQQDVATDNSKSVQTSFIESQRNEDHYREETSTKQPDINDNLCDEVREEAVSENNIMEDPCEDAIRVNISIEEARNLPYLKTKDGRIAPQVYVTLFEHSSRLTTLVKEGTCPVWNYEVKTKIDAQYITNPRKYLILKVWHYRGLNGDCVDPERDQVLGYVAVDLTPLMLTSFTQVSGWYNITDWLGKCRGQIKLTVTPLQVIAKEDCTIIQDELNDSNNCTANQLDYYATAQYSKYPSHLVYHNEVLIRSKQRSNPDLSIISEASNSHKPKERNCYWHEPSSKVSTNPASISMLERTLNSHLADLNNLTKEWLKVDKSGSTPNNDDDSSNRTFTIDEADRNDSVVIIDDDLKNAEQVVQKNLDNLRNFMKQGTGAQTASGRSSRTSLVSEELPRDDQPNLMDLGLVLEDLEQILDLESDGSRAANVGHSNFNNGNVNV